MKILIIGSGFTGATLPLANRLANMGHDVKFYNFVQWRKKSIESIDFENSPHFPSGRPVKLPKSNKLYSYLNKSVDFYLLPCWNRKRRMEKLLIGKVLPWLNKRLTKKYINIILSENADIINLIVHTEREMLIADALNKANAIFCISYHEVLQGLVGDKQLKTVVEETVRYDVPIIIHSHKTASDLINKLGDKNISKRINVINFGAFESFLSYGEGRVPDSISEKYLLYLGHIQPYKGLKYLYEAVQIMGDKLGDLKIVVAGGGYDPIVKLMRKNDHFIVYNHFIDNAEVVGLIRHCQAIICPYVAASQSGLVQTSMVFEKPVIATKVGAFEEIIHDGENGYLCEPSNAKSLANTLLKFIENMPTSYKNNIPGNLNWDNISRQYVEVFNKMSI